MFRRFSYPNFYFNTPEPGSGGAGAGAAAQPVAPGGDPAGQGAAPEDGFWGMFPDIPQEHRALLEPHLKGVQGHVTKLEQQYAPFKSFTDAGLTPEGAQGLIKFSADFDRDPLGMWFKIGEMLQNPGQDGASILDSEIDLDHLAALARGEDPDALQPGQPPEGQVPGQELDPQTQQLLQQIQALQQQVESLTQNHQQEQVTRQESMQNQLLDRQMAAMRETLKTSGWPEEAITDEDLTAAIVVARGDIKAATTRLLNQRSNLLKGFTESRTEPDDLELPNGVPGGTQPKISPREKNDSWAKARVGAQSTLRRENRAAAQQ